MKLSVIIVNWNALNYLCACLSSLYTQLSDASVEVIVVDNGSTEDCSSIATEFPAVQLIKAGENLGFARANNLGYGASSGEIVLFLNPDTEIVGDALQKMIEYLSAHPKVAAVGPRLLNTDYSLQASCVQAFPTITNQLLDCDVLRRIFPRSDLWGTRPLFDIHAPEAEMISGACFMVKRTAFDEVGKFDEDYFMYAEDLDLSYKLHIAGHTVHCLNDCRVVHHGGRSSGRRPSGFAAVIKRDSLALFLDKTRGPEYARGYRAAMGFAAVLRMLIAVCAMPLAVVGWVTTHPRAIFRKWMPILRWSVKGAGDVRPVQSVGNRAGGIETTMRAES
jgi:hypothetical protein